MNRGSIQLKVLPLNNNNKLQVKKQSLDLNVVDDDGEENEYREIYPDLTLTEEQANARSKQFKIFSKPKKEFKSEIIEYSEYFKIWKPINKVISRDYGEDVCSYFKMKVWIVFQILLTSFITVIFILIPMMIIQYKNSSLDKYIYNLLSSDQSWLTSTPMFYGFYNNTITYDTEFIYSMSRAYLYVNILSRVFYYLCLLRKFIINLSVIYALGHIMKSKVSLSFLLVQWDFKNVSHQQVNFNKTIVRNYVKKVLLTRKDNRNVQIILNIFINIFSYGLIALILERMSWLISFDELYIQTHSSQDIPLWLILRVPVTLSLCIVCATWLFDYLQCIETFHNDYNQLYSSLLKIIVLNVGMLVIMMYHWTKMVFCAQMKFVSKNETTCYGLRSPIIVSSTSLLKMCWETWIGQRVFMNFATFIIISAIFSLSTDIIKLIFKALQMSFIKPRFFQISLFGNIFFLDCLFWFGFYYSPLMSLIYLLILVLTYFYHMGMISVASFPRTSSQLNAKIYKTFFLLMLLISSLIAFVCLIYQSVKFTPSSTCGPFQNLEHNYQSDGFQFSEYFRNQTLILQIINIGSDIIFDNKGVWYSITIIILILFFQYIFGAIVLGKIRRYVIRELHDIMDNKKSLAEDLKLEIRKLKVDKSTYKPRSKVNSQMDQFFEQFIL